LQERRTAEDVGGREQPASGATQFYKGDVRARDILVENKTTSSKQYGLKLRELEKIKSEALMANAREWAFQIDFQTMTGNKRFVVIDWERLLQLLEAEKTIKSGGPHYA
jgi:hypothetical protein